MDNNLTKVSNIELKLDDALDRLEVYFKKREEILNSTDLDKVEKIKQVNEIRKEYASSLNIDKMIQ